MLSDELNKKYDVSDFIFFGDFSNPSLANEMQKIRGFTNQIVETNNGSGRIKKDYTDFIMLDHIYRSAYEEKDLDTYIIFTGDGHFSSAVLFLKNSCKKEVIVYGVKNAFSGQLKLAATGFVELPSEKQLLPMAVTPILDSLFELSRENQNTRISFSKTVPAVAQKYDISEDEVKIALEKLIEKGYIIQYETNINKRKVRLLRVDFKKAQNDGLLSE